MSALTDFESLKQQIVEVVTKDPSVRYIFLGWVTDQFAEKVDLNKILEEVRASREASERRFEASDRRFDAVQQEIKELREVSERRFEAADKRFDCMQEEMQKGFARQERYSKILAAKIDKLGGRWGIRAETAFRQGMSSIVQEIFEGEVSKWETEDTQGQVYGHACRVELDIVISNGICIVVEIKSQANRAEVAAFYRIVRLYQHQTGSTPDRWVLIVSDIDSAARDLAQKLGIEVFTMEEAEERIA